MITDNEKAMLVAAWRSAPDATGSGAVADMVRAEVTRITRAFDALKARLDIRFVEADPYKSYAEMRHDVLARRRMLVWTGASETPLWDEITNWKARAVHDWDHIEHDVDFSIEGETAAYRRSAARVPGLAPLYLSEIVLQAAVQTYTGSFDEQKLVLPSPDIVRLVNSLREARPVQSMSMAVWLAAGWLKFMKPADLMIHLHAMGLDLDSALIVADAAAMLDNRSY